MREASSWALPSERVTKLLARSVELHDEAAVREEGVKALLGRQALSGLEERTSGFPGELRMHGAPMPSSDDRAPATTEYIIGARGGRERPRTSSACVAPFAQSLEPTARIAEASRRSAAHKRNSLGDGDEV